MLQLQWLPPIRLQLAFPGEYPSEAAPRLSVHALWLSPVHLAVIEQQLMALWEQAAGSPICYSWVGLPGSLLVCQHNKTCAEHLRVLRIGACAACIRTPMTQAPVACD